MNSKSIRKNTIFHHLICQSSCSVFDVRLSLIWGLPVLGLRSNIDMNLQYFDLCNVLFILCTLYLVLYFYIVCHSFVFLYCVNFTNILQEVFCSSNLGLNFLVSARKLRQSRFSNVGEIVHTNKQKNKGSFTHAVSSCVFHIALRFPNNYVAKSKPR